MIVHVDAKALEWCGIVWFSQDKVGMQELHDGVDQHTDNQTRFKLPTRLIAKTFVFRLIYGGTAYAYALDSDFQSVGYSAKRWQEVIDEFYRKYKGIERQHNLWMQEVSRTGRLVMPTGRVYEYQQYLKNGDLVWPRTTILNYPVQGFGADLMMIVRVLVKKKLKDLGKLICTIHDSLDVDAPEANVSKIVEVYKEAFAETPAVLKRVLGINFNVPFKGEILIGNNFKDLKEIS